MHKVSLKLAWCMMTIYIVCVSNTLSVYDNFLQTNIRKTEVPGCCCDACKEKKKNKQTNPQKTQKCLLQNQDNYGFAKRWPQQSAHTCIRIQRRRPHDFWRSEEIPQRLKYGIGKARRIYLRGQVHIWFILLPWWLSLVHPSLPGTVAAPGTRPSRAVAGGRGRDRE